MTFKYPWQKRGYGLPITHEEIAELAYNIWVEAGSIDGITLNCWLVAEAKLKFMESDVSLDHADIAFDEAYGKSVREHKHDEE